MCSNQRPVKKPATKTHPHQNQQPPVLALGPVWQKSCCAPCGQWKGLPCTPCFLLTQHTGSRSCKAGQEQASVASSRVLSGARAWETCPGNSAGPSAQTVQDLMHLGKCCIHLSGTSCLGKSWWEIHGDFTVQDLFTRTHHSHGQEPRTQSRWFPTLGTPDSNLSRLWTLCFSALGFSLFIPSINTSTLQNFEFLCGTGWLCLTQELSGACPEGSWGQEIPILFICALPEKGV